MQTRPSEQSVSLSATKWLEPEPWLSLKEHNIIVKLTMMTTPEKTDITESVSASGARVYS